MERPEDKRRGRIYVVGTGPGGEDMMTGRAKEALDESDVIIGYKLYTDLIRKSYPDKEIIESGMRQEMDRCQRCIGLARQGRRVCLICSGDAGVYGMASPMLEVAQREDFYDVEIIPGVTAALSGAALLGAPIGHDFCIISLSDLLTPPDLIEKRLKYAAMADMCIVLYNPASRTRTDGLKKACDIMLTILPPDRICGYVMNIGREGTKTGICTLSELKEQAVNMQTTVFIGNSKSRRWGDLMITPRGYDIG